MFESEQGLPVAFLTTWRRLNEDVPAPCTSPKEWPPAGCAAVVTWW